MAEQILAPDEEVTLEPGLHIPLGQPAIWWHVLEVDTEHMTALLLADEPVEQMHFDERRENVTWEDSSLRAWLNSEFPDRFSHYELEAITGSAAGDTGRDGLPATDSFFLLSLEEAEEYITDKFEKKYDSEESRLPWWWLRTTSDTGKVYYIRTQNRVTGGWCSLGKRTAYAVRGGVRPACRIDLRSRYFAQRLVPGKPGPLRLRVPQLVIRGTHAVKAFHSAERMTVPEGITELDRDCFRDNVYLQSLTLPCSLRTIGDNNFDGCCLLKELTVRFNTAIRVPGSDEHAVRKLRCGLIAVGLGGYDPAVGLARLVPPGAEELTVPEGVTELEDRCFQRMMRLRAVTLPGSLQTIGEQAFSGCQRLEEIRLPARAAAAFPELSREKVTRLSCSLTAVGAGSSPSDAPVRFFGAGAKEITVPEGVTEVETAGFSFMTRLHSVDLPSTLRKVGPDAFLRCPVLRTVTTHSAVTEWAADAIVHCLRLKIPAAWLHNAGPLPDAAIPKQDALPPEDLSYLLLFQHGGHWDDCIRKKLADTELPVFVQALCDVMTFLPEEARPAVRTEWVERFLAEHTEYMTVEFVNTFCGALAKQTLQALIDRRARAHDTVLLPLLLQYRDTHPDDNDPLKDFSL